MTRFFLIVILLLAASGLLAYLSSDYQKYYNEPIEKKNDKIYPFYEIWAYIAGVITLILVASTVIHRIKMV